ncbi:MAG: hypothetical protein ABI790_06665, partial [Betaproteobacteria bacterium]
MKNIARVSRIAGVALFALSFAPVTPAGTVPASSVVGAQSSDDVPLKPAPGSTPDRARAKTPVTTPSADWAKAAVLMAQDLMKEKKYAEALARLDSMDSVTVKSSDDSYLIERTRVAIASFSGDQALLVRSVEAVMAT